MASKKTELHQIQDQAQAEVSEYKTDLLREQLVKTMGLKIPPPDDSVIIGELSERLSRLKELEEHFTQIAVAFNCPKDKILENVVANGKLYQQYENAQAQLEKERGEFARKLRELENDATRAGQQLDSLRGEYDRLLEEIGELKDEDKRQSVWSKLLGIKERGENE